MADLNGGLGSLAKIRQQINARRAAPDAPRCPHCGHPVTVDVTDFFESRICENCFEYTQIIDVEQCCRKPNFHHVKLITAGGAIQVREQCQTCGYTKANAIGGLTAGTRDALPLLNVALRESRYEQKWEMKRQIGISVSDRKRAQNRENWFRQYNSYLQSPEWRRKRDLVLRRDNYTCQCCLSATATQVHHKSYEFVDLAGNEPAFDLVAVCTPCHEKIESMKNERRAK